MLDIFKQQKSFLTRAKEKSFFRFVLDFDKNGAFVEVCDKNNKPLSALDYRVYNGLDREILQLLEEYKKADFFAISWEDEGDKVYLFKHSKLLELLRLSENFYYNNEKLLSSDGVSFVELDIVATEKLAISLSVDAVLDFRFLTSSFVLIEKMGQATFLHQNINLKHKIYGLSTKQTASIKN